MPLQVFSDPNPAEVGIRKSDDRSGRITDSQPPIYFIFRYIYIQLLERVLEKIEAGRESHSSVRDFSGWRDTLYSGIHYVLHAVFSSS